MAEQILGNISTDFKLRSEYYVVKSTALLILLILFYNLLYRNLIVYYFPMAAVVTLLLIPLFTYLLQRKLLLRMENSQTWKTVFHAIFMILIAAIGIASVEYLAALSGLKWYFLEDRDLNSFQGQFLKLLQSYLYWYLLVGIPGSLLSRFVLYLQLK